MAHFNFTRAGGIWADNTDVTSADLESLDEKTEKAVNGDDGGTWSPTTAIIFGGAGLQVDGPFVANDTAEFNGTVDFWDTVSITAQLMVSGSAGITGDYITITGNNEVVVQAPEIHLEGGVYIDGGLAITGGLGGTFTTSVPVTISAFAGNPNGLGLHVQSGVRIDGILFTVYQAQLGAGAILGDTNGNGQSTLTAPMLCTLNGRVVPRALQGAYVNTTYAAAQVQWVVLPPGAPQDLIYTIDDTGCIGNEVIGFTNRGTAYNLRVHGPGGYQIKILLPGQWVECQRIANVFTYRSGGNDF